jgi:hypothetical protein
MNSASRIDSLMGLYQHTRKDTERAPEISFCRAHHAGSDHAELVACPHRCEACNILQRDNLLLDRNFLSKPGMLKETFNK